MRLIKKILKYIGLGIAGIMMLLLIAYIYIAKTSIGWESEVHQKYLKTNMVSFKPANVGGLDILNPSAEKSNIILLGEAHGYRDPQLIDFAILKHLHQKFGLRHYLAEVDYSQAFLLNNFLETGNQASLDSVFQFWRRGNLQWANKEFMDKVKSIRDYNYNFGTERKIHFVGIDRIQDLNATRHHLRHLIRQNNGSISKESYYDSLAAYVEQSNISNERFAAFAKKLILEMSSVDSSKSFVDLKNILRNVSYLSPWLNRDSVMSLNFHELVKQNNWQGDKFYGMWGIFHTIQSTVNNGIKSLAVHLKNSGHQVTSINFFSADSEMMVPSSMFPSFMNPDKADYINLKLFNSNGPVVFVNGIQDMISLTENGSSAIFNLTADGSPYKQDDRLTKTKVLFPGQNISFDGANKRVTDAFQFAILMRNSKALTPLPLYHNRKQHGGHL